MTRFIDEELLRLIGAALLVLAIATGFAAVLPGAHAGEGGAVPESAASTWTSAPR
jgi:hypothetical protein